MPDCVAETLQAAHDYIEMNGFDIMKYEPVNYKPRDFHCGPCCYIGTVRLVGNLPPLPSASENTPNVETALELLDRIAEKEPKGKEAAASRTLFDPGRLVERLGLEAKSQDGLTDSEQRDYALSILRKALREIHAND